MVLRPSYRDVFNFNRTARVFFYTSNLHKLLQARLIFGRYGYALDYYRSHKEPYDEVYDSGTNTLLERAIRQVHEDFGLNSIFFVEDTSLRIDALSDEGDYPGVRVKEWFSDVTFQEVDMDLNARGIGRRATVKSDIGLFVPTLSKPIFVHAETSGTIANTPPIFEPSVQYPWLTPETFNGWFIPDGSHKRLGEMEFEESLDYDFRAKSIIGLISRIDELNAGLNLKPQHYHTRERRKKQNVQLPLLGDDRLCILVIGNKCAGKSTFGDYMTQVHNARVFEASSVLRSIADDKNREISGGKSAISFLKKEGMDIVARQIVDYIDGFNDKMYVITGLRTVEEAQHIVESVPRTIIISISADDRIRFERHIRRARDSDVKTFKEFQDQDNEQLKFGLLRVYQDISDIMLTNESDIEAFQSKIDEAMGRISAKTTPYADRHIGQSELSRSLYALNKLRITSTCEEISEETKALGFHVAKYNTNRALKEVPEFAKRVERDGDLLSYKALPLAGKLLHLIERLSSRE